MILDESRNKTYEFYLNKAIENCLKSLIYAENYTMSVILGDIWEKRPKIYVVHDWPEHFFVINSEFQEIDLMIYVNGIIKGLGCQLVIE